MVAIPKAVLDRLLQVAGEGVRRLPASLSVEIPDATARGFLNEMKVLVSTHPEPEVRSWAMNEIAGLQPAKKE